jgi:hypothetical protein
MNTETESASKNANSEVNVDAEHNNDPEASSSPEENASPLIHQSQPEHVKGAKPRPFFRGFLKSLLNILAGAFLLTAGIGLIIYIYIYVAEASITVQFILGIATTISFLLFLLWKMPKWQVSYIKDVAPNVLFELENEARKTLAQILAGVLLLTGLYGTWRTLQVSEQSQITERFNKAIDQIGNDKLSIRLGAIYALERLSEDSARDHNHIIELLTAYVRENAQIPPKQPERSANSSSSSQEKNVEERVENLYRRPSADIQAILNVLKRRPKPANDFQYDPVDFRDTNLYGANLTGAYLHSAKFFNAELSNVYFIATRLTEAQFIGANLKGALFGMADLKGADFSFANLEGAILYKADIEGANFTYAKGMNVEQFKSAINYGKAKLPSSIAEALNLRQK